MKVLNIFAAISIIFACTFFGLNQFQVYSQNHKPIKSQKAVKGQPVDELYAWAVAQNEAGKLINRLGN